MMLSTAVAALGMALAAGADPPVAQRLQAICTEAEIDEFGLECSIEEPCPVLLEVSAVGQAGSRLIVVGNLHTATATLWSVLMMSSDGGQSWTEPLARMRATVLDQLQIVDGETGFVAGQVAGALAADPFVLKTSDGGQTWRRVALFDEPTYASVDELWFDSRTHGRVLVSRKGAAAGRHQLLESATGGDSWSTREVSERPLAPLRPHPAGPADLRLRVDRAAQQYVIERRQAAAWMPLVRFELQAGVCRPAMRPSPAEPEPPVEVRPPGAPAASAHPGFRLQ